MTLAPIASGPSLAREPLPRSARGEARASRPAQPRPRPGMRRRRHLDLRRRLGYLGRLLRI
jgi:hypothetical protein